MEKSYKKVVQYVKNEIIKGNLRPGDRLASERELAGTEEERVLHDKSIHIGLVAASHNEILVTNYDAINSLMDNYIKSMRVRIISGMQNKGSLMQTHRMLVDGILENDLEKGLRGLRDHFDYIDQYKGHKIP